MSASTSASKLSIRLPSTSIQGSPGCPFAAAAAASFASILSTTKLSWLEASSVSANRKRSSRSTTSSRTVQKKAVTPPVRLPVAASRSGESLRTGARICTLPKHSAGRPSLA